MSRKLQRAEIGIFGGSGFYELFDKKSGTREITVKTPYGAPSDKISIGEMAGRKVAFLPRHGKKHQFAPQSINYRANVWAFKKLGVSRIIAPCAAGSLQPHIKPGDFVICNQYIDRTKHRVDSFYPGPKTVHIGQAEPYCSEMRQIAIKSCKKLGFPCHEKGDVVVMEGPRFSTRAESYWYQKMNWEVINMTQYPEVVLARELEMCYVNISMITDYDAGLIGQKSIKPVAAAAVIEIFAKNIAKIKKIIFEIIKNMPRTPKCRCHKALGEATL